MYHSPWWYLRRSVSCRYYGLFITPSKSGSLVKETQRKFEQLQFGCVAEREGFRGVVISKHRFSHDDTSLPRQLVFFTRFMDADYGPVWMLIKDYINQLCRETPTHLRIGGPTPKTNFKGLEVTLTKTQCKVALNAAYQLWQDARQ
jgi:hypothetical protein